VGRETPPPPDLSGLRLLMVEDEPDAAEAMAASLRVLGAEVDLARDFNAVRALLPQGPWDALVTDLDLGGGPSGIDVLHHLRQLGHGAMASIAVSAYGAESDRRSTSDLGFDAHLVKPVDAESVARAVLAALRHFTPG
jgi:DNA-binding response OmpR family regulator